MVKSVGQLTAISMIEIIYKAIGSRLVTACDPYSLAFSLTGGKEAPISHVVKNAFVFVSSSTMPAVPILKLCHLYIYNNRLNLKMPLITPIADFQEHLRGLVTIQGLCNRKEGLTMFDEAKLILQPQEQTGSYKFDRLVVMTTGFQTEFGDDARAIVVASLKRIRSQHPHSDYLQVFTYNGNKFYSIDDEDHVTFLMPYEY